MDSIGGNTFTKGVAMRWIVEGADHRSGADRRLVFEAPSRMEAEDQARKMGVLVSGVTPANDAPPVSNLKHPIDAGVHPSPPSSVAYATPNQEIPTYRQLSLAAMVLNIIGGFYYAMAILYFLAIVIGSLSGGIDRWLMVVIPTSITVGSIYAATMVAVGALFQGASAACIALRDIARNSWKEKGFT